MGTIQVLRKVFEGKTLLTYLTVVSALALTLGYLSSNVQEKQRAGRANRGIKFQKKGGVKRMKIVNLCAEGSCCPVIKITDTQVEIGEKDNTCVLTKEQWEVLKEKILKKEI